MSGIFGILDARAETDIPGFLVQAATRLSHFSWYHSDTYIAPGDAVGLGRVGIGILNTGPQPVISPDGRLIVLMTGELRDTGSLRRRLEAAGISPRDHSDPELSLCAFQVFGPDFVREIDGDFMIAIYDTADRRLILTNDRFGLYPHYYYCSNGRLVFAPEVKGVLSAPFVERKLDLTALAEYFRFQQLLGSKTFHQGISLFPYASVGQFDLKTGDWSLRRYWDWQMIAPDPNVSFQEAVIETGRRLRRAVERRTEDHLRPGVFLSGGLDSRTLLGLVPPRTPPPVSATFGMRGCQDVHYAERIARTLGSRHHWFDLPDGRWVLEHVNLHLTLTEGFHSWIHAHGITMLPRLREVMDYNLTGWDGGTVMGHPVMVQPAINDPVDDFALITRLYGFLTQLVTWPGMTEAEERMVYTPDYRKQLVGLAFESLMQEFAPYQQMNPTWRAEYFFMMNHDRRSTHNMNTITRSHLEVRFPFWDYQLIDFMYSLKPDIRSRHALYHHVITRETPRLARIPSEKDDFWPTANRRQRQLQSLAVRLRKRLRLYPKRPTLYADYENYLRYELRQWAEAILFDTRTEQRGILNLPYVRSLMARHVSGQEQWTIGKIAPLITFEMMMRRYFD